MQNPMFNAGNIVKTFTTPPVAPGVGQTTSLGTIGGHFAAIAELVKKDLAAEVADGWIQDLFLSNNGIVGSYLSPAYKGGNTY